MENVNILKKLIHAFEYVYNYIHLSLNVQRFLLLSTVALHYEIYIYNTTIHFNNDTNYVLCSSVFFCNT